MGSHVVALSLEGDVFDMMMYGMVEVPPISR